jgi:hypothetical protein
VNCWRPQDAAAPAGWKPALLQDVPRQIVILDDVGEDALDERGVDRHLLPAYVAGLEGEAVEHALEDRVQPARSAALVAISVLLIALNATAFKKTVS